MEDQRSDKTRNPSGQGYVSFLADVKVGKPKVISASDFVGLWGYQRRGTCVVRQIENDVMHFRPRQLELDMEERINYALNWLRQARPRERSHVVD